jgi:hypothetical protein
MHAEGFGSPVHGEELEAAIRHSLAKLAHVDLRYRDQSTALEKRSLSQGQKAALRTRLAAAHSREREPLVLQLANLHYRMMRAAIFGSLAKAVPSVAALRGLRR